jgi:hypothetical protein
VLDCSALEFEPMAALPDAPTAAAAAGGRLPVWLCLDEVMDPVSQWGSHRASCVLSIVSCLLVASAACFCSCRHEFGPGESVGQPGGVVQRGILP